MNHPEQRHLKIDSLHLALFHSPGRWRNSSDGQTCQLVLHQANDQPVRVAKQIQ